MRKHGLLMLGIWTVMIAASFCLNIYDLRQEILREVATEARAHLELNLAYRKVIASFGGVYVPAGSIRPNPFLEVSDQKITARNGREFVLINAAHLIRAVFEYLQGTSRDPVLNKLVALSPSNPDNLADTWEGEALRSFARGSREAAEVTPVGGRPYFRMIVPFVVDEGCLRCHAREGYRTGDMRGGISIAVPMERYYTEEARTRRTIAATHGLLWLIVSGGLLVFTRIRLRQEEKIVESERKFRMLSDSATDWMFWVGADGRFVYLSPSTKEVTGYDPADFQADPRLLHRIVHPDDRTAWTDHLADGHAPEHEDMELRIVTRTGDVKMISHVCAPIVIDGVFHGRRGSNRDITERWKLSEQLRQAQKMEAVGLLAGGIAHDFNNILTAIIGYGNIANIKLPPGDPARESVDQILLSAARAANLTQSLLAFSRTQSINPQTLDLNDIVVRFDRFLSRILREDITLRIETLPAPLVVMADRGQLEQVLMNLTTNARDAMPAGGALSIATDHIIMDEHFVRTAGFGRTGEFAVLRVSDTGTGMDEATRERIFDPFFTTKEVGRGTGLGLAMVYGAVQQNDGYITVESTPGTGTSLTIYLPLRTARGTGGEAHAGGGWDRGTETILVAEDDAALRRLLSTVLGEFGYTTIEAADGDEAVARFRERPESVDLLLLDVIMPKRSGKEVWDELRKEAPGLKALFMSGHTVEVLRAREGFGPDMQVLVKPIAPQMLLQKVRETLGPRKA